MPAGTDVDFWGALWPAVVATFVGVVLGVPVALYLGTLTTRKGRAEKERQRVETVARIASILRESIAFNVEKAGLLHGMIENWAAFWDSPLEVARWDAVRDEFVRHAHDPRLQSDVALFFHNVKLNAERVQILSAYVYGPAPDTDLGKQVQKAIREHLLTSLPALAVEADEIDPRLKALETV